MPLYFLDGRPYHPQPADWCTIRSHGAAATGIRIFTRSEVNHAELVVGANGRTLGAQPGGATWATARGYIFRHPDAARLVLGTPGPHDYTRGDLAAQWTIDRLGIGYNLPGLAALGLAQWPTEQRNLSRAPWVSNELAATLLDPPPSAFCSQLVDAALHHAGIRLFDDGRAPGNVAPRQLHAVGLQRGYYLGYIGAEQVAR